LQGDRAPRSGTPPLQEPIGGGGAGFAPAPGVVHPSRDPRQEATLTLEDAPLGEMMRLFIAQRRILERQRRLLRRIARRMDAAGDRRDAGTAAADRLLQRRRP